MGWMDDSILPVLDGGQHDLDRGPAAVTVHRALELTNGITGPVCISDLCMALNVNPRTLHKADARNLLFHLAQRIH